MAEEDLDLEDDDLDLGGDDFAGELDDMMGDDELSGESAEGGGGGDEGDSDSELDSFFEDLSSIEDMDEGVAESSGESGGVDDEEEEEVAAAAPTKPKKAAPTDEKKGGKLKYIIMLLLVAVVGGIGYLYKTQDPSFFKKDQPPNEELVIPEEVITVEKQAKPIVIPKTPVEEVKPEPKPEPVKPPKPKSRYLIQVATCSYEVCKEDYIRSLRQEGEPVYQKDSGEKYDFIELISKQVYSYSKANSIVKEINRSNKMAGNASIVFQSNGHRISMGNFPALDRAKEVKFNVEKLFPRKDVLFNLEHVRKSFSTTKIFAGPYNSRNSAKKVLADLRSKPKYKGAFLVRYY